MKNGDYALVIAPQDFPGKKYRNRYCLRSHLVYWQNTNVVPTDKEIIHHKNGNKYDDSFENLEIISREKHSRHHTSLRGRKYVHLKCPFCNKIFELPKNQSFLQKPPYRYNCCSKECANKFKSVKGQVREKAIKECFIDEFKKITIKQ